MTLTALIPVPLVLCAAGPHTATTLQLRQDGPSLDPEEAKALTPQALGDALLVPGHLPIIKAVVGPQGMEPSLPPGGAFPTRVKLYLQPSLNKQSGFCRQIVATTYLPPARSSQYLDKPGGRPVNLATEVAYRWVGQARAASACDGSKYSFFIPSVKETQRVLEAVRLLAIASQAAKKGGRLGFPLSVQDKEGLEMLTYQREHPEQPSIPDLQIITDAKKALACLPIDEVTFAGPSETTFLNVFQASDLAPVKSHTARGVTVFLGGDWTAGIVIVDGRIVRMRLQRAIPPPF